MTFEPKTYDDFGQNDAPVPTSFLTIMRLLAELRDDESLPVEQRTHDLLHIAAYAAEYRMNLIRREMKK